MRIIRRVLQVGICFVLSLCILMTNASALEVKAKDEMRQNKTFIEVQVFEVAHKHIAPASQAVITSLKLYNLCDPSSVIELSGTVSNNGWIKFEVDSGYGIFAYAEVSYGGQVSKIYPLSGRVQQVHNKIYLWLDPIPNYTVTYYDPEGDVIERISVPWGTILKDEQVPDLPDDTDEYHYSWDKEPIGQRIVQDTEFRQQVEELVSPTTEPTASPTTEPTASPTTEPTASPTTEPTASPTAEPTASPTTEPTASPTVQPAASPSQTSVPAIVPTQPGEDPKVPAGQPSDTDDDSDAKDVPEDKTPSSHAEELPKTGTIPPVYYYIGGCILLILGVMVIRIKRRNHA